MKMPRTNMWSDASVRGSGSGSRIMIKDQDRGSRSMIRIEDQDQESGSRIRNSIGDDMN